MDSGTHVLVEPRILLAHGLVPDDVSGREAHDKIDVIWNGAGAVDVVAQRMGLGEENLGQMFFLRPVRRERTRPRRRWRWSITLIGDDRSSHCIARFTFAKAYIPCVLCSCCRFCKYSWVMTRDTNDELLLTRLFLGLRLFKGSLLSLPLLGDRSGFPSPNTGEDTLPADDGAARLAGGDSESAVWLCPSLGCSWMLGGCGAPEVPASFTPRSGRCAWLRGASTRRESLVPALGGGMAVASGFEFCAGGSDGCGSGVARWRLSRRT